MKAERSHNLPLHSGDSRDQNCNYNLELRTFFKSMVAGANKKGDTNRDTKSTAWVVFFPVWITVDLSSRNKLV